MDYLFLGGAAEVGGSCMPLSIADRYLLFDCGILVNKTGRDALPDLDNPDNPVNPGHPSPFDEAYPPISTHPSNPDNPGHPST